ncbi:Stp1/IreP family PP2C-type Ser/Thr phosphatase [Devriesea agamarum]|uniref:Stp1/IreP family PP2C-type Ser/Thr phosphatase n=1 Tax=Devriesea agamarum TaxID=472569 RepID=UPI00071C557A|nr:Stp1/IreP family PP2C-type Ser/Thr phosphatase [Devriesea agamarum]
MTIALDYAARSDVGLVRSNNQDSGYAGSHLLVIADGMGGHAGGDVASSVAIGYLAHLDSETPATDIVAGLEETILQANDAILQRSREEPQLAGLGTTVTALLRSEGKFALAHIGDSRAYLLREGQMTQVTKDHTFVQRLMDEGRLTEEEAERHPQRSVLMRVLGDVDSEPDLDLSLRPAHPGDRWLLCSDGLSGIVSADTIAHTLTSYDQPGDCAEALVQLALKGGGPDNVTVIVADVIDLDDMPSGYPTPSTTAQVVGSAARDRNRPTAATGPAARAAALTRPNPEVPFEDEDFQEDEPPRRTLWPLLVIIALLAAVTVGLGWLGYQWSQKQYFVGTDGANVVVYRGINQDIGPISLFEPEVVTPVKVADLPPVYQERVRSTITAQDRGDAERIIASLKTEVTSHGIPTPTPDASVDPTADPSPSPAQPSPHNPGPAPGSSGE